MKIILREKKIKDEYINMFNELKNELSAQKQLLKQNIKENNIKIQNNEDKMNNIILKQNELEKNIKGNTEELYDILDKNNITISNNEEKILEINKTNKRVNIEVNKNLNGLQMILANHTKTIESHKNTIIKYDLQLNIVKDHMKDTLLYIKDSNILHKQLESKIDNESHKINHKIKHHTDIIDKHDLSQEIYESKLDNLTKKQKQLQLQIKENTKEYDTILEQYYRNMQQNKQKIGECMDKINNGKHLPVM
jgi:hypothetical protein